MSTLNFDKWQNRAGTEEYFKCRAFVNFNGTGTVAIRASGNVSSITDNGTGRYTINFSSAMPDANYVLNAAAESQASFTDTAVLVRDTQVSSPTVSAINVINKSTNSATAYDISYGYCAIFR